MEQILSFARREGYRVEFLPLGAFAGLLMPGRLILIDSQIPEWRQREAVAHELGHAWHGHDRGIAHEDPDLERQADLYAARLLISPTEYALAEAICEHPGAIAKELMVSAELVTLWQEWLHRQRIPA
ncbi:ImmA/IrrE family metallo-endopeptidase [Timonella senegalensis]|uniref:ImmA/IrrE family metallo-endopeptidase n=1 Tax=Timonella senegalensis TaxID=1465825 RepID=UPI0028AC73D0|nr:ImmA/IrrE family metallo-endopeptidase [Timonella senegalensis]